ncbi:MAG: hypothetical protein QOH96_3618 [Blastocatellia bacterium]|jgi:hypothetical protein|nr:hypothetical protein [Blastocatellia bacterium]
MRYPGGILTAYRRASVKSLARAFKGAELATVLHHFEVHDSSINWRIQQRRHFVFANHRNNVSETGVIAPRVTAVLPECEFEKPEIRSRQRPYQSLS